MTTPELPQAPAAVAAGGREPYDVNVGRWTDDHPGWCLRGGDGGFGYAAQRVRRGGTYGPVRAATNLDALAVIVEQADRWNTPEGRA